MLRNNVFIHVGLQKTGTTWIQEELFGRMPNINLYRDYDIIKHLDRSKKVVISMEWLCGTSYVKSDPYENRFDIARNLASMYPDAKIILGLRDKKSWVRSTYSQYVKNGGVLTFDVWLDRMFDARYLNYGEYVDFLKKHFKEVYVYQFENLKKNKKRFAQGICKFIGEPVPPYVDKVYNKKFSPSKLFVMRQFNKLFYSKLNEDGLLPGTFGHFFRHFVKRASGSWQ